MTCGTFWCCTYWVLLHCASERNTAPGLRHLDCLWSWELGPRASDCSCVTWNGPAAQISRSHMTRVELDVKQRWMCARYRGFSCSRTSDRDHFICFIGLIVFWVCFSLAISLCFLQMSRGESWYGSFFIWIGTVRGYGNVNWAGTGHHSVEFLLLSDDYWYRGWNGASFIRLVELSLA